MMRFVLAAALVLGSPSFAAALPSEPVGFSFAAVPLNDFAQATYRNLLGRDYVLSSDLLGQDKKISVSVKGLPPSKVSAFVDHVLASHGVSVEERDGVFFLDRAKPESGLVQAAGVGSPFPGEVEAVAQLRDEYEVVTVGNRSALAMAEAVNQVAGERSARAAGGSRLVLGGPPDRIKVLRNLVDQLDQVVPNVEVEASFIEVTTTDTNTRGLALVASAVSRRGAGVTLTPASGSASLYAGSYELLLDALAADSRFKQVSRSRVFGEEAEKLSLSVGDETPTIGEASRDQAGNVVQSVVYRSSGVLLDVVAKVLGSGRLSLQVDGQVSSFQATANGVTGSPTLVKRQVKTSVSLADGQVLVIGGLADSKTNDREAGFSFLPRNWRTRVGSNQATDLLLVLTARVVPPM